MYRSDKIKKLMPYRKYEKLRVVKNICLFSLILLMFIFSNVKIGFGDISITKSITTTGLITYASQEDGGSSPSPTPSPNPPPISSGFVTSSELINFYSMTSSEVSTFVNIIKNQNFTEITLRLNAMNEWSSEQPSSSGVAKVKEIITACQSVGISVNIDLHTWYTTWDNYFRDSASGSSTNRAKYLNYVRNSISAFEGYPVKAWMVLNEPQARTATSSENNFILSIISAARERTTKPVSVRFMGGYSPSTGHYSSAIDDATDFLCRNVYWDPRNPSQSVYGVTQAKMDGMIQAAHSRGKELWITEFGKHNDDQQEQAAYIRAFIDYAKSKGIDRVYAWVIQTENSSAESYNLFDGYTPLPAFYEIN